MQLQEIENEVHLHIRDAYLSTFYKTWINDALLLLATEYDFPALKRKSPFGLPVNTGAWLYDLPDEFLKDVFKCRNVDWKTVYILDSIQDLDAKDIDHDETGDAITHIAVDGRVLAVFPKADDTARLWWFDKPDYLDLPTDSPIFIPSQFHRSVVVPKTIIMAYPAIQDMGISEPVASLKFFEMKLSEGLYGRPGGEIGMVHWLADQEPLRRTGGRESLP